MKRLLALILYLLDHRTNRPQESDKETFEHLDGAEFFAVLPEKSVQPLSK